MSARRCPALFRPGNATTIDQFVTDLRARRWQVAETHLTLDNAAIDADLIVLRAETGTEAPSRDTAAALRAARARGVAILIEAEFEYFDAWAAALATPPSLLAASMSAMWQWWRPGRMVEELVQNTAADQVRDVVIGVHWTLVMTDRGCGLAQTPAKVTPGFRALNSGSGLRGRRLDHLAAWARTHNPLARAIGMAAINAGLNIDITGHSEEDGLTATAAGSGDGPTVVIGRFPGLEQKLPGALVIEKNPGPNDLPAEAADNLIPGCGALFLTASTFVTATTDSLLALNEGHAPVTMVGPGTPLSPRLHAYGIDRLAGFVVQDAEAARQVVKEAGGARQLRPHGQLCTLRGHADISLQPHRK